MPRNQRRDGELITMMPTLFADHMPDTDHFPPLEEARVVATAANVPASCPTPRWCSTHGPCQSDGCRYDDEPNWPPAA